MSWFYLPRRDALGHDVQAERGAEEHCFGIHSGDLEASVMLELEQARKLAIPGNRKSAKLGWQTQDGKPAGAHSSVAVRALLVSAQHQRMTVPALTAKAAPIVRALQCVAASGAVCVANAARLAGSTFAGGAPRGRSRAC